MPKRRRIDEDERNKAPEPPFDKERPKFFKVRLPSTFRSLVSDLLLLDIDFVKYIQANGSTTHYLYQVIGALLDISEAHFGLYTTISGLDAEDDSESWTLITNDDRCYSGGVFLCKPSIDLKTIWVERIIVSSSWPSTPRNSPRSSTPAPSILNESLFTPGLQIPPVAPMGPPSLLTASPRAVMGSPSVQMISPRQIIPEYTVTPSTLINVTARSNSGSSEFRELLIARDNKCVVSGVHHTAARASHLIPQHLLNAVQTLGGVVTGNYTFTDPYDERVGILLCPDIDWHVDKFQASFFIQNDSTVLHLFRNTRLFEDNCFTPTALREEGEKTTIRLTPATEEVINWHYKHAIIRSWGGASMVSLLKSFWPAGVDQVAWSTDSDDELSQYSDDWL